MRWFFRWLWRFNALLIAVTGLVALVALVAVISMSFNGGYVGPWGLSGGADASPGLEIIDGASGEGAYLAVLTTRRSGRPSAEEGWAQMKARNLLVFSRGSGEGRRLFEADDGEVTRFISIDSDCAAAREHHLGMIGVTSVIVNGEAGYPPSSARPVAAIALWKPARGDARLIFVDLATGASRELARGVTNIEEVERGRASGCSVFVRRGDALHEVEFALGVDETITTRELTFD